METTYTLKNFRVFDEKGAKFKMAPLTILTGCNSSGKSSVTKSLMLLNSVMKKIKQDIRLGSLDLESFKSSDYVLDFTEGNHNLGNFDRIINWNSSKDVFSVKYTVDSKILCEPVEVEMVWSRRVENKTVQSLKAFLTKVKVSVASNVLYVTDDFHIGHFVVGKSKDALIRTYRNLKLGCLLHHIQSGDMIDVLDHNIKFNDSSRNEAIIFFVKVIIAG